MAKDNKKYTGNDSIMILVLFLLSIAFLFADWSGGLSRIRSSFSFVFEPITFQANNAGTAVRQYLDTFIQLGKFRKDYNEMKVQIYDQESTYSDYIILKNENEALKQQLNLGNTNGKYILANVLRDDNINAIYIDEGTDAGVAKGDVVSYGNVFIGTISQTDRKGSVVKLPTDSSSHLQVAILKPNTTTDVLSSAVVSGSVDGIKVENISMNADVANGDVIFVNDTKVGGFLTLGYIVGLSDNPSSTYRTAYVSTVLDFDTLMKVFVRIN